MGLSLEQFTLRFVHCLRATTISLLQQGDPSGAQRAAAPVAAAAPDVIGVNWA